LQRGLFERHKLLFALMLTNKILVSAGKVKPQDVDILLKGGGALDITSVSTGIYCMQRRRLLCPARKAAALQTRGAWCVMQVTAPCIVVHCLP
jgi:hypothetical protein